MLSLQQNDSIRVITRKFGLLGRLFSQMELNELKKLLSKSEKIEAIIYGVHRGSFVIMVATDERLHFIDKRLFNSRVEDFDYLNIESIEYDLSVMSGMVRLNSASGMIDLRYAPNNLIHKFVSVVEYKMQHSRKVSTSSKRKIASDIESLERLADLRHKGDLSEAEFQIEKDKIINKI